MGVAGCGKSTVGAALAAAMQAVYIDGDDLHPPGNIAKMAKGLALDDADRAPWLDLVGQRLALGPAPIIVGCSALKRLYRDRIRAAGGAVVFVHLAGSRAVIEARMAARTGHFMPLSLLDSQFAALEPPAPDEASVTVDIDQPLESVVSAIQSALGDLQG